MHNGGHILKSLPGGAKVQPPPEHRPGAQTSPVRIDVLGAIRQRPRLAAGVFLLIVLAGVPLAFLRGAPKYSSEVSLYVSPTYAKNSLGEQENYAQYNAFVTQQMAVLERYDILAMAIKVTEHKSYAWQEAGETEREAIDRLRKAIEVRHAPDTYLISISLDGPKREGLAETLNGLATIAMESASSEGLLGEGDRRDALVQEKTGLETGIAHKNEELSRLSGALGMVSIDQSSGNPEDTLLAGSRADLEEARKRRLEAETQFLMIGGSSAASKAALLAIADEKLGSDTALNSSLSALNQKAIELKTSVLGMSSSHPLRKAADQQLAEIDAQITALRKAARQKAEDQTLDKARGELNRARAVEGQLEAHVRDRSGRVEGESKQMQTAASLEAEITRDRARLTALDERIDYLAAESTAPSPLRIFSQAREPLKPTSGTRKKWMLGMFVLASFASIGLVVGIDALDSTVRDTASVEQILGFSPTGLVLEQDPGTKDFANEHLLRLVSGIERARESFETRTIVFTSLLPGGGASRITEQIGNELTAHDLRVLRIEANPAQSLGAGARDQQATLIDVLRGACQPEDAIQSGGPRRLDWIALGPTDGPQLPGCHRFGAVLAQLRPLYDLVLIDAAPLLLSSDTETLIGLVDATMVVVRAGADTRASLVRANRLLRRLEPAAVGCVLNRVKLERGGAALRKDFAEYESFRNGGRKLDAGKSPNRMELDSDQPDALQEKALTGASPFETGTSKTDLSRIAFEQQNSDPGIGFDSGNLDAEAIAIKGNSDPGKSRRNKKKLTST